MAIPVQTNQLSKFDLLVKKNELSPKIASQLKEVLSISEIVLLCDDSGSMQSVIKEPGSNKTTTRWLELKNLAAKLIEIITSVNPNGLDIFFMNRPTLRNVISMDGLQRTFSDLPNGYTPLIGTLQRIYIDKANIPEEKQLLILILTDGRQSDGSNSQLYSVLYNKRSNVHISIAECTDDEEEMEFLDSFKNRIKNYDNTDDFREEMRKVKRLQGPNFKFDYTDYVIKVLLSTFIKDYFNIDQTSSTNYAYYNDSCDCCILL